MKPEKVYEEIEKKSLPLIQHYAEDLTEVDKTTILHNKKKYPFLHFTGKTGTHLIILSPREEYPKKGEEIKYLFGHADRFHVLKGKIETVEWCVKEGNKRDLILYFDGNTVRQITEKDVKEIIYDYEINLKDQFYAE